MAESEMIERVARAIHDAEIGYHIRLDRLVDGIATYTLRYDGSEDVLEFPSHADAYDHVRDRLYKARSEAAIRAMREPTRDMLNASIEVPPRLRCRLGAEPTSAGRP